MQHGPHRVHPKSAEGGQKLCTPQRVMHVELYRSCSHFFCVLLVLEDLNVPAGTTHNTQLCGLLSYALFWATTTCCKMVRFCPRVHNTTNDIYIYISTATHGVQKGVVGRHIRHGCMVTGCHALFGPNSDWSGSASEWCPRQVPTDGGIELVRCTKPWAWQDEVGVMSTKSSSPTGPMLLLTCQR